MSWSMSSSSPSALLGKLQDAFDEQDKLIAKLQHENDRLRSENYKDEELAEMERKMKAAQDAMYKARQDANRGFPITEDEDKQIEAWIEAHERDVHGLKTIEQRIAAAGCCGGGYSYRFVPTSIGVIGEVVCSSCGESFCFQELD